MICFVSYSTHEGLAHSVRKKLRFMKIYCRMLRYGVDVPLSDFHIHPCFSFLCLTLFLHNTSNLRIEQYRVGGKARDKIRDFQTFLRKLRQDSTKGWPTSEAAQAIPERVILLSLIDLLQY